ncbi:betaine-aldehyde dehydrogenase, partial [Acinetobacter pittii]|nr:betaine-aldehyde dehydrogenase [Acinetobacter pittii]
MESDDGNKIKEVKMEEGGKKQMIRSEEEEMKREEDIEVMENLFSKGKVCTNG